MPSPELEWCPSGREVGRKESGGHGRRKGEGRGREKEEEQEEEKGGRLMFKLE
jgi:hypothetical protein